MFSLATIAFAVAAVVFALSGFLSNGFIAAVILREWTKSRSLASNEQLLLSLAASNFWATALLSPFYINATLRDYSISEIFLLPGLYLLATFVIMSRFWFTAWLCFFYCIKIITSRQAKSNITVNITNTTEVKSLKHTVNTFEAFFLAVGSGCPLLVVLLCSILVVASLCRHVCRIAAQTLSIVVTLGKDDGTLVAMVRMVYPSAQASILMLVNPKLKQAAMQMLQRAKV
nr:PREDICTED: taste receptor type 2 member 39-like [Anolis carolinensis]|eukprot:XP_016846310.1 PREDICTED: taste receptor type 2 member 39-like [Anolis carolinensis]